MEFDWINLLFLCPAVFFAGLADAVSGGGGLIALPAFLVLGLPVHMAYGTNKITCCVGTAFSTGFYFKNKAMDVKYALIAGSATVVVAALVAQIVLRMSPELLGYVLTAALPIVAVVIIFYRKYPENNQVETLSLRKRALLALLIGVLMGCYDGFLGPGSGTVCILLFTALMKYDLLRASGNTKVLVLLSTAVASVTYLVAGNINWFYAIPAIASNVTGSIIGSRVALTKGAGIIRPMMIIVAVLLMGKMIWDTFIR